MPRPWPMTVLHAADPAGSYVARAEHDSAQVEGLPPNLAPRPVARGAVIGAGIMGSGLAVCFANAGVPVAVVEADEMGLRRGLERIAAHYDSLVKRGRVAGSERSARLALIEGHIDLEAVAQADIVIESVFEELDLKRQIFSTLDRVAKPGAVLATNTSYLEFEEIASATARPQDVIGTHFLNPANAMRLVEIARGKRTSAGTLATVLHFARRLGKLPVVVGASPGLVGNRMLARRTAAAEQLLLQGASPQEIDQVFVQFGFRMGPFALFDLAGLEVGWRVRRAQGRRAVVADALCEAGRLGQIVGKGYYAYPAGDRIGRPDPELDSLISGLRAKLGIVPRDFDPGEIVERLVFPMINEGVRILQEGVTVRPSDIDVVWIHGYGWPAARGGPMFHGDTVGLPYIAARLNRFAEQDGDDSLRPAPLLRVLVAQGRDIASLRPAGS